MSLPVAGGRRVSIVWLLCPRVAVVNEKVLQDRFRRNLAAVHRYFAGTDSGLKAKRILVSLAVSWHLVRGLVGCNRLVAGARFLAPPDET